MTTSDLPAAFGDRFELVAEYAGGEGQTLCIAPRGGGPRAVLKVLPPGVEPAEASLLLSLRHPSIPAVREVGRLPDGRAYVLREHQDGEVLRTLPRDPTALRSFLQQLLEVLAYVHLRSVLHLDLKPANLLLDPHGRVHLLDFGLGARDGARRSRGGTLFFAAPEQLLGGVPDARADLFAIGAMTAQALWPGSGPPLTRFLASFPAQDFFAAGDLRPEDLPAPFDHFVARCVARQPAHRFPDAQAALEFLAGGSGRPSFALLAPDPVVLYGAELPPLSTAGEHLILVGSSAGDRRALAMHIAATAPDVRALLEVGDTLRVERAGPGQRHIALPRLHAGRLLPHVQSALGLQGTPASAAAEWLAMRAGDSGEAVGAWLQRLATAGELVPSGTRWTWPAARSGRLDAFVVRGDDDDAQPPTQASVRAAALSGRREQAIALWRRGVAADPGQDLALRRALVEGLLDGGEPAQALPFCGGLSVLRAQALLDTGQLTAAAQEMTRVSTTIEEPRHRRTAALLAMARGELDRARELLEQPGASAVESVTLAAVHEQAGRLDDAERVLAAAELSLTEQPFACASAHTVRGHVARRRGDLRRAQAEFQAAAELLFELGHVRHAASAQQNLGVVAKDLGEHALAVERLREARTLFTHVGDAIGQARTAASLGIAALARGDAAAARPWLLEAVPALQRLGDAASAQLAQVMLARVHAELGDRDQALALLAVLGEPATERMRNEMQAVRERCAEAANVRSPSASSPLPAPFSDPSGDRTPVMNERPSGPSRELFRTFLAVNRQLAQETALDKAMRHLLDAAVTLSGGRIGYLLVARDDGMRREFQSGDQGPVGQAFSRSLAHRAMQLQRTLTGADALSDRDLQDMPSIRNLQVRSAVCAPFRSAGGTVGAIYVEHPGRAGAFTEGDKEALEVLADQAAIAVDRMLREEALQSELHQSQRELAVVRRTTRKESTQLLGDSKPMRELRAQIDKLAPLELPVLVLGETGTGKELVARALHERSQRHRGPFVAENCSVLPGELMERELFGHVQGSFTGADRDRPGLLELASGGTLFLDEVGDMPPALQAKLLRSLQEQSIRRVGGSETIQLDLRLVAATHKDLRAMVQRGEFREDLFFRIAAVELRLPALREREGDIVQLAEHFVQRNAAQRGRSLRLSAVARAALRDYRWPGNVRELEHVIARAALLCDGEELVDLQLPRQQAETTVGAAAVAGEILTLKEAERRAIVAALQSCGGDKAKTARVLGISRTALYEKLKRFELG
jgi:transcriptional regulator with GAF, ATPase, and Fis domain/tetratricopeptide (TPR) repeat protein